ncbi:uncharacterized protein LOC134243483 isoform X2 [Saccostrea cucullata]|uniref:uncharacterized protein LOC134243483 isoform X2 n=1 Tax=Saccostrea cuccullata TaxID=36930 RepID=UPI002ED52F68
MTVFFSGYIYFVAILHIHLINAKYCAFQLGRKYGNTKNCTKLEHCKKAFDDKTGACLGPENQCEPGWMGPGCQYINLAYKKKSTRPSLDGNLSTSEDIKRIRIDFYGSFIISALNIHAISSNNVTIKSLNNETCFIGPIKEGTPLVFCSYVLRTRMLDISFTRQTTVSEIEVYGGRNVALWRKTSQSSDYNSDYTSDKAVDGWDSGGDLFNNSCTLTYGIIEPNGPYWRVNLGSPYSIMSVRIASRNKFEKRLNGFRLIGENFTNTRQLIYSDQGNATPRSSVWVHSSLMRSSLYHTIIIDGKYLVNYKSRYQILALCEVEVFACRLTENDREDCVSFCPKNCQQSETCLNENFTCPKCNPGWEGPHCTQVVSCKRPDVLKRNLSLSPDYSSYEFNTTIHFTCLEGFIIRGYTQAVCGLEGIFINNNRSVYMHPSCEAITCSSADNYLSDIIKTPSKLKYNYHERINFSCASGYALQKPTVAVCEEDGLRYTDGYPNCTAIQCNRSTVTSSNLFLDPLKEMYAFNVTITFSCKKGYNLRGSKSGKCLQNNVFVFMPDDEKPYCEDLNFCRN